MFNWLTTSFSTICKFERYATAAFQRVPTWSIRNVLKDIATIGSIRNYTQLLLPKHHHLKSPLTEVIQPKLNCLLTKNVAQPVSPVRGFRWTPPMLKVTLNRMHRMGKPWKVRNKKNLLDSRPQMKGVVLRTVIKKPRKPNSANRRCVLLRLSNGKQALAYVPGVGHNLQEHNMVLVEPCRLQDTPGVFLTVIRGKYDCGHVIKKTQQ